MGESWSRGRWQITSGPGFQFPSDRHRLPLILLCSLSGPELTQASSHSSPHIKPTAHLLAHGPPKLIPTISSPLEKLMMQSLDRHIVIMTD